MVIATISNRACVFLAETAAPLLQRLDPITRTKVLMALLGLVLLGITMIACVMIGGRWVRQLARHSPRSTTIQKSVKWGARNGAATSSAAGTTSDTIFSEQQTDETVTD